MAQSDPRTYHTATIAAAGSASAAVALGGGHLVGIIIPSTGSGDFSANTTRLYFQGSVDGTTYKIIRENDGTAVAVTVAAANTNGMTHLDPDKFRAWPFVKVATHRDDTGAAVAQAGGAVFTLIAE
jgi:hypothetical protein